MKEVVVRFIEQKQTKNTYRFEEIVEGGAEEPTIGTLYIPKATVARIAPGQASPVRIAVTVAAA